MMSADTYMNEMLLVATKQVSPVESAPSAVSFRESEGVTCVNISRPLHSLAEAYWYAKLIMERDRSGRSGRFYESDGEWGSWARLLAHQGQPWHALGIRNSDLAVAGLELLSGQLYIRREAKRYNLSLSFTTLDKMVEVGPTHHLIGHVQGNEQIGIFTFHPMTSHDSDKPTFPALWAARSNTQKSIALESTHKGEPLPNKSEDEYLRPMLDKRSDLFISRNARMTSQALAAAITSEPVMGGRAWAALLCSDDAVKAALALWFNSTFSAIIRTCYAQTTQPGRATMQINAIGGFPVPDFAADSESGRHARAVAMDNIDSLSHLALKPFSYAFNDNSRHQIDRVVLDMLGLGGNVAAEQGLDWLRYEWCREPSTHGGNAQIMRAVGVAPDL